MGSVVESIMDEGAELWFGPDISMLMELGLNICTLYIGSDSGQILVSDEVLAWVLGCY